MDSSLSGDSLLTEDDFNDFAAAVGEAADGSDDNPRTDDFLSWLLVHAETIDPMLGLDQPEEATVAAPAAEITEVTISDDFGAREHVSAPAPVPPLSSPPSPPPEHAEARTAAAPDPGRDRGLASAQQGDVISTTEEAGLLGVEPLAVVSLVAAPVAATNDQGLVDKPSVPPISTTARDWEEGGRKGEGCSGGDRRESSVGLGAGCLLGELTVVGGIPSDPVLAMQMGARMALAGKINLIPFGITAGAGMGVPLTPSAHCPEHRALQPVALGSSVASVPLAQTGTSSPANATTAPGSDLPKWAGLPPPQPSPPRHFKGELAAVPIPPGRAKHASGVSVGRETLSDAGEKVEATGANDNDRPGQRSAMIDVGDFTEGLGEKRARTPSLPTAAEIKTVGRDSFKDGRRRKRMSIVELEERVKQVSEDNARLKLHLSSVNDKTKLMAGRKNAMEAEIAAKLEAQGAEPSETNGASLAEALSRFKDLYADYGAQRRREVQFHLKQLERQIVPTDTTKMSLWTLEQDESFYKDRKRGSLFNILRDELWVSEEQIGRIQERRTRIKGLLAELGESLRLVKDLQKSSEAKNAKFEEVMARLQSSFSPQQIARLILWVSANRGRISKLPLLPNHVM